MSIYATKGKALEYAPFGLEIYKTCPHKCSYCYNVTHDAKKGIVDADKYYGSAKPIMRNPEKLRQGILNHVAEIKYLEADPERRVLLSFGSDPYPEEERHMRITREAIKLLVEYGVPFQTLSKNPQVGLLDLDLFKAGDARFASTILFLDEALRDKWEPGAPSVESRLAAIKTAHEAGVFTWVSVEPVVDPGEAIKVITAATPFVNMWKVGKLNYLPEAEAIDWGKFAREVYDVLRASGRDYVIKNSLAAFLPALAYRKRLRGRDFHI